MMVDVCMYTIMHYDYFVKHDIVIIMTRYTQPKRLSMINVVKVVNIVRTIYMTLPGAWSKHERSILNIIMIYEAIINYRPQTPPCRTHSLRSRLKLMIGNGRHSISTSRVQLAHVALGYQCCIAHQSKRIELISDVKS